MANYGGSNNLKYFIWILVRSFPNVIMLILSVTGTTGNETFVLRDTEFSKC
jgi:hypothetical protein